MNIAIVFSDLGPYHVARIEALAIALEPYDSKLCAIQFTKQSSTYKWRPALPTGVDVITLAETRPIKVVEAFKIAISFHRVLQEQSINIVFLPSYSPLPNLLCVLAAKLVGCKAILMNDSWHGTEKTDFFRKIAKHIMVRAFDAALVAGTPQKEYAYAYGQKRSKVFLGYDVVDINYYARESKRWKEVPIKNLPIPNLPARYFLNLGRFVPKKNIAFLIQAYAHLYKHQQGPFIALILVGEGSEESAIRQVAIDNNLSVRNGLDSDCKAIDGPEVVFYPFQQIDRTPLFFSHCEAFILPSLYDEWGLVINEAMACEAAVLVSENVGCAQDLVEEGKNGFLFNPKDVNQLCGLLRRFISDPTLTQRLGKHGSIMIRQWGPDRFARGAINAIRSVSIEPITAALKTNV